MSEEEDIDKKIEELQLKKKLQDLERQKTALQPKPEPRPKTLDEQIAETHKMLEQNQAFMDKINTPVVRRGREPAPQKEAATPAEDPVQQFLEQEGKSSVDIQGMQTEDANFMPRRVAAQEVSKWLNIIVLLGTINLVFAFLVFSFNMFGLGIISVASLFIIIVMDAVYMMKATRQKNYLAMKYKIYVPRGLFSKRKQMMQFQQQQQPQQYPPDQGI